MKCLIRTTLFCLLIYFNAQCVYNEIISNCELYCANEPILEENDSDLSCNDTCKLNKCENGCHLYKQALESSCQILCDESGNTVSEIFYCKLGCSQALNAYVSKKKKEIGTPLAPFVVANSIKNDSLILEWKVNPILNIKYLIQWKYASSDASEWIYYNPDEKLASNRALIANLHAYTEYRFRVAWILFPQFSPIFSEPSLIILTKPYGIPSYPPRITSLVAVSSNHISLTWETARFPNGPILAYYLYLNDNATDKTTIKVINAKHTALNINNNNDAMHYMFTDLKPGTVYTVSVSCLNEVGEGPKLSRRIETPQRLPVESNTENAEDAYLILASEKNVIKQSRDIMQLPEIVFRLNDYSGFDNITSLAIHVSLQFIFVSDTSGTIRRICFRDPRNIQVKTIYKPTKKINSKGIRLSMDWLNDKLYFSDETSIARVELNGNNRRDVIAGFNHMISELHVDPYNGYLYYTYSDTTEGGIYRVDMNRIKHKTLRFHEARLIYRDPSVNVFTIDYSNYRIYLPKSNSIISLSLGGEDANDIRKDHVDTPQFINVKNIVHFNETFFWTTGVEVFKEEYDETEKKFYHNAFALEGDTYVSLQIFHQKYQPFPVPHNAIENLEVVFSDTTAKVQWSKPPLLGGMAQGAWQEWFYEIRVEDTMYQNYTEIGNITEPSCVLHELSANTVYKISVRAYSKAGKGPWCSPFVGSTFKSIDLRYTYPHILWGTKDGLLQSNIVGDDVVSVLNTIKLNRMPVKDITWFKDTLFVNANYTTIFSYNTSTYSFVKLPNVLSVKSIAIDWITPMIYFSNPINQMISRMNIDGTHIEVLPLITLAKEIAIDAKHAKLYWITDYSLECSRLNGFEHKIIFQVKHFSGKQLMSLTLDLEHRNIYWIVKSFQEIVLYKADLVDDDSFEKPIQFIESIGYLRDVGVRGSVKYFDKRLFFVHQFNTVLITDLKGKNRAFLHIPGLQELDTVNIVDPSMQIVPEINNTQINVIPNRVSPASIRIDGKWDNFTVVWSKVDNVNFGEVFYDLRVYVMGSVDTKILNRNIVTKTTIYNYPSTYKLQPYSLLKVSVKSFTYWASGESTTVDVYTPMSTPSKPQNPRVFITNKNGNITAEFRWLPSANPNGMIKYYKVNVWYEYDLLGRIDHSKVTASALSHKVTNLKKDKIYSFQVQAFTEAGGGPLSDVIQANSSISLSAPKLIVIQNDAIKVFDVDLLRETEVSKKVMNAVAVAYIRNEKTIYWIEEDKILKSFNYATNQTTVLNTMNGVCISLTADWISRNLYWSEIDSRENKSTVWRFDLNSNLKPEIVFQRTKVVIKSIEVHPFTNSLFWSEMHSSEEGMLKKCQLKNNEISSLFGKHNTPESGCNCPYLPVVGGAISIDATNEKQPKIIWSDVRKGIVWSSDLNGCKCEQAINLKLRTIFTSVGADQHHYYWSTRPSRSIFKIRKQTSFNESFKFATEVMSNVKSMKVYQQQNYFEINCLSPLPYDSTVKLANKGYSFLVIVIPKIRRPQNCENFSLASVEYKLYYGKVFANKSFECDLSLNNCRTLTTYNQTVTLTNLEPYTNYSIRVEARNYYSIKATLPGPEVIFDTKEWHPSPPSNVTIQQVTPFNLLISWQPPVHPNGDYLKYEIRWFSEVNNGSQFVQTTNITTPVRNKPLSFELKDESLLPSTKYWFKVRAVSPGGDLYSDSIPTEFVTDENPHNLTIVSRGSRSLSFTWLSPPKNSIKTHILELFNEDTLKWVPIAYHSTNATTKYSFNVTQLRPNTNYHFRLSLQFYFKDITILWPLNGRFTFKTKGEVPPMPATLLVIDLKNGYYKITWNSIESAESKPYYYELFQREEETENWVRVYKGTNNFWVTNETESTVYVYKVRAVNEFGESNFSEQSVPYHYISLVNTRTSTKTVVAYVIGAVITILLMLALLAYIHYKVKKQNNEKKSLQELDIVPLPELPSHHHENNAHYLAGDINIEELSSVPQITRNQVKLNKFLGSGAFAEVYEGLAHNFEGSLAIKVAVKTLRSGATESQKADFLKEAKLMGNFKHPHILKLLALCLDNNPFLIFELMEGGDLLSYLRLNRPEVDKPSSLTMDDLLRICVDVARGCEYLEDMHFVHRDLAARNCLVSSFSRTDRIVKIGDFGLARDIYKNDYYRKEGEGLLPVRWMAPESLVDGVFTTQSDIWSFAVLVWEVLTLGQHPYTARANVEVWNYVRSGGRLDIPSNCPEELSLLLNQCWNYKPEMRPSFSFCLKFLEELQKKLSSLNMVITMVHNQNYVISRNSQMSTLSSAATDASMITSDSDYNTSQNTSKYSTNLDHTAATDTDGYEVPLNTTTTVKRTIVRRRIIVKRVVKDENSDNSVNVSLRRRRRTRRRNSSPPPTYSQIFSALQRCTVPHCYSNSVQLKDFQQEINAIASDANEASISSSGVSSQIESYLPFDPKKCSTLKRHNSMPCVYNDESDEFELQRSSSFEWSFDRS